MGIIEKRIVMEMTAEELPERMRGEFSPNERVRVTIETEPTADWDGLVAEIEAFRRINSRPVTQAEAVARIETLRDEWN